MSIDSRQYREHTRFLTKLHVRYNKVAKEVDLSAKQQFFNPKISKLGYATDFSVKGVFLLVGDFLRDGDVLAMNISLPVKEMVTRVSIQGYVRWFRAKRIGEFSESRFDDYPYCCGVEFLREYNEDSENIDRFINYWRSLGLKVKSHL